jgi:prepilin-type N-terminal cleavage/methylation domain-containing protein
MRHGFTLIELAVVVAIIGLVAGGIVITRDITRSAELTSVMAQSRQYHAAIEAFTEKYQQLPGDMFDAIDYWGAAHATPATCRTTPSTGLETCNGDGDWLIEGDSGAISHEQLRAWQHLSNGGFIEGTADGATVAGSVEPTAIDNGQFSISTTNFANLDVYSDNDGVALFLSNIIPSGSTYLGDEISDFTAPEAKKIDNKMDDGIANSGLVLTAGCNIDEILIEDMSPDCPTNDCNYDLDSNNACHMVFYP